MVGALDMWGTRELDWALFAIGQRQQPQRNQNIWHICCSPRSIEQFGLFKLFVLRTWIPLFTLFPVQTPWEIARGLPTLVEQTILIIRITPSRYQVSRILISSPSKGYFYNPSTIPVMHPIVYPYCHCHAKVQEEWNEHRNPLLFLDSPAQKAIRDTRFKRHSSHVTVLKQYYCQLNIIS